MTQLGSLDLDVAGKTCRLGAVGLEVQFLAAERLRARRDEQFERTIAACGRLDGEPLRFALELAFARQQRLIGDEEVLHWLQTLEGAVFTLWRSLLVHHADATEAEARALYQRLTPAQSSHVARFLSEGMQA